MTEQPKTPQVSLIVAVYNTAPYLNQCLDSILRQTVADWELVVVDDGSTDGSAAICDDYARRDRRISVLHKPNSGKPDSCNLALQNVRGEFVAFVDSDDWLAPDMLEVLLRAISETGVDFASCGYLNEFKDATVPDPVCRRRQTLTRSQTVKMLFDRKLYGYLHGRLFRRSLLQEPIPQLGRYEDFAVIYKWVAHGCGTVLCPECLYHYRQRGSSIMNSRDDMMIGYVPLLEECYHYIIDHRLLDAGESKAIALRNYIRIAKDIGRKMPLKEVRQPIQMIREAVVRLQPVPRNKLKAKTLRRTYYLRCSDRLFIFIMRISRVVVLNHPMSQFKKFK